MQMYHCDYVPADVFFKVTVKWLGGCWFEYNSRHEKDRAFYPEKKCQGFSQAENIMYLLSTEQDHPVAYL